MSRTNETRHIKWHETCKCKCRLDASVCNNKQQWNNDKCQCECKELIDKGVCDKGYIWNPRHCEWECDKNCDFGEYLDYQNCKCRKKLVHKLIDKCPETIDERKLDNITFTENENNYECGSCIVHIVLMIVVFRVLIGITVYLVDYNWYLIKNNTFCIKFNTRKNTEIWWV